MNRCYATAFLHRTTTNILFSTNLHTHFLKINSVINYQILTPFSFILFALFLARNDNYVRTFKETNRPYPIKNKKYKMVFSVRNEIYIQMGENCTQNKYKFTHSSKIKSAHTIFANGSYCCAQREASRRKS